MPVSLGFFLFAGPLGSIFSFGTLVAASQVALGLGLSLAASLIFKPKAPETPKPEDGKYNLRQNVPSLAVVLGRNKKGGDYAFLEEVNGQAFHIRVVAGHRIHAFLQHYLHDEAVGLDGSGFVVFPTHFASKVQIGTRLGLDAETAYGEVVAAFPSIWDADFRGDGLATTLMIASSVPSEHFQTVYPQQMPVQTDIVQGALLYDPRNPAHAPGNDDTWTYSENLALIRLFHLTHPSGGKMTLDDMHLPDWEHAADVCDQIVLNKAGGSEPRYHGGLWYRYDNDPVAVGRIIDQAAELVVYETAEGKVGVHAGEYVAPDIRLTADDIISLQFDVNRRKNSNVLAVRGRFTDPDQVFNTVDAAIYGDPYVDESERSKTVDNVAVQRHNHMARLQKITYIRSNAPRVQIICNYEAAQNVPYRRFIKVHYPPKLDEAIIEITGRPQLSLRRLTYTVEGIVVPATLYDYVAATEEGAPPVPPAQIPKGVVPVPTGFSVSIESDQITPTQAAAYAVATWTPVDDSLTYELEWEPIAGGTPQRADSRFGDTSIRSAYLADDTVYKFRLRTWSAGASSDWTSYIEAGGAVPSLAFHRAKNSQYLALLFDD